jgi:hypothetical protein
VKSWWPKSTDVSEVNISDTVVGNGLLSAGKGKGHPTIKQMPQLRCATWEIMAQQFINYALFLLEPNVKKQKPRTATSFSNRHINLYRTKVTFAVTQVKV